MTVLAAAKCSFMTEIRILGYPIPDVRQRQERVDERHRVETWGATVAARPTEVTRGTEITECKRPFAPAKLVASKCHYRGGSCARAALHCIAVATRSASLGCV